MNLFNLLREIASEGYQVSLINHKDSWIVSVAEMQHGSIIASCNKPTPEEAVRAAYLEMNPIPKREIK